MNDNFDIITVYNPSDAPFEVFYNSSLHKVIQPHQSVHLVKMIAGDSNYGAIKHLIDMMCRLDGVNKNDPKARASWYEKIVVGSQSNSAPVVPTPEAQAIKISEELDKPKPQWKFDPITGQPLTTPEPATPIEAPAAAPLPHPDAETNSILTNLRNSGETKELPAVELTEEAPQVPESVEIKGEVTREQLLDFARNELMMDMEDAKTKEMLETKPVEELRKILNYDNLQ